MKGSREEWVILVAIFLDLLGFGMIIANIQLRAAALVPSGWPVGVVVGALLASTFVVQLVVSPHWGSLSDVRGRKPVLIACTLLSGSAMLVYGLAGSVWVLLVSRILAGLGSANVAVAQAYISDRYSDSARAVALGRIGAAISTGLILGPPIGGLLGHYVGDRWIGVGAGAASLLGGLMILIVLPNLKPTSTERRERRPVLDFRLLREQPGLVPLVLLISVAWFSLAMLEGTFARLINELFGYDTREFGFIFGYESLVGVVVQGIVLGWILKRWRERRVVSWAYVLQGVGLALNPLAALLAPVVAPLVSLFAASTLYAVGTGVANPTVNDLCSRKVSSDRQGELFGLLQSSRSFGFVLGPLLGGALFDWQPSAPYLFAGLVCLSVAGLSQTRWAGLRSIA